MVRWGAVCGLVLAVSIGVPGLVEALVGETAVTSFVIGIGAAFGSPALTALHLRQSEASGRFGMVAYAVGVLGLGLFAGVAFALNLVVFFLDPAVAAQVMAGPTRIAVLASVGVFVAGSALFSVSMVRAGVFPKVPAVGYGVFLVLLAVLAPLPDTPLTALVHVAAAVSVGWLCLGMVAAPAVERRAVRS